MMPHACRRFVTLLACLGIFVLWSGCSGQQLSSSVQDESLTPGPAPEAEFTEAAGTVPEPIPEPDLTVEEMTLAQPEPEMASEPLPELMMEDPFAAEVQPEMAMEPMPEPMME